MRALPDSLLGRSFLLIAALLLASVAAWFEIYRAHQREPIAIELAQQTVSIVNLTRSALINSDPARRGELLAELSEIEGIRVFTSRKGERLDPVPTDPLFARVAELVRGALGERTRLAYARDGVEGFWVSFLIDEDAYWVMLPREKIEPDAAFQWLGWGALALALSLAGAWWIATRIARPLDALARAARRVGRGETPEPLAEGGPRELRAVAAAFNRMAQELERSERERANVLAGISHDLRTPLARLRLGLELSGAERAQADAMAADVEEIDAVIGQFLDYARGEPETRETADLEAIVDEVEERYARLGKRLARVRGDVPPLPLARMAVRRALANLIDNALRYAGEPIEIETRAEPGYAVVEVRDRGPGIPDGEAERLKRPFTRLDPARSGASGAGLGLAIVDRVARAHGGSLELGRGAPGGLVARLRLASA